ncbi:hypothetical protein F5Y17DRAFT_441390 [Xylariaceae sp. FL0594]|nr:hypothetical protein F5Y17DRAFT_441390 [Xylariaceae sp. FL0594]
MKPSTVLAVAAAVPAALATVPADAAPTPHLVDHSDETGFTGDGGNTNDNQTETTEHKHHNHKVSVGMGNSLLPDTYKVVGLAAGTAAAAALLL